MRKLRPGDRRAGVTRLDPALGVKELRTHAAAHIHSNHTVGCLQFLIKIRYRITMSGLMKYA